MLDKMMGKDLEVSAKNGKVKLELIKIKLIKQKWVSLKTWQMLLLLEVLITERSSKENKKISYK